MSAEDFHNLYNCLDATACFRLCAQLGLPRTGTKGEVRDRVSEALRGSADRLLALLDRDDLIAALRTLIFHWDDRCAHVLGLRDASIETLRAAATRLFIDDWDPSKKNQARIPGTELTLCWYDEGAPHAGEFDDDDGAVDNDHDLLHEAIYTIVHPEMLEGREQSGVVLEEGRAWTAGARLLERARKEGRRLVVVLADARETGRLLGWTYVRSLTVADKTTCHTGPIVRVRRGRLDSIRKLSDGLPLSLDYIRPYVPCHLPSFVPRTLARMRALEAGAPADKQPVAVESLAPTVVAVPPIAPPAIGAPSEPLLAFSWGYEGWGSHTADLVEAADAVEAARGYGPPLFVDVRFSRKVRAIGFRERAFDKLLGPERHVWLQGLGNRAIGDASLDRMVIHEPAQARTLLDLIVERAARRQRVIFFCSCGSPFGRQTCHRGAVTKLLLAEARRRKLALAVHEWPGGSPLVASIEIPPDVMRRLRSIGNSDEGGTMRIPVPRAIGVASAAGLPHVSLLRCRSQGDEYFAASGPALRTTQGWMFPVHNAWPTDDLAEICGALDRDLKDLKLTPHGADLSLPGRWRMEDLATHLASRAVLSPEES